MASFAHLGVLFGGTVKGTYIGGQLLQVLVHFVGLLPEQLLGQVHNSSTSLAVFESICRIAAVCAQHGIRHKTNPDYTFCHP